MALPFERWGCLGNILTFAGKWGIRIFVATMALKYNDPAVTFGPLLAIGADAIPEITK